MTSKEFEDALSDLLEAGSDRDLAGERYAGTAECVKRLRESEARVDAAYEALFAEYNRLTAEVERLRELAPWIQRCVMHAAEAQQDEFDRGALAAWVALTIDVGVDMDGHGNPLTPDSAVPPATPDTP